MVKSEQYQEQEMRIVKKIDKYPLMCNVSNFFILIFHILFHMSDFIRTREAIEPPPLFQIQSKEIQAPNSKLICHKIRSIRQQRSRNSANHMQKIASAEGFHQKLRKKEKEMTLNQNSVTILQNFKSIKKRWMKTCQSIHFNGAVRINQTFSPLHKYFQDKNKRDQIDMKQIMRNMPKKVMLEKKYNSQVMLKYGIINEALQIDQSKKQFRCWRDKNKNNSLKSPIYLQIAKAVKFLPKENNTRHAKTRSSQAYLRTPNPDYQARKKQSFFVSAAPNRIAKPIFTNKRIIEQI